MLWAFLHTHSPRSTCDLSFAVVAVLSVLLRCAASPLNSFGRPQACFQVRICSFGHCDEWGGAESRGNGARPVE